jgi:hypothetical protein
MTDANRLNAEQVLAIVQQRFPREYEIAVQQAYIANLETALRAKGDDGGDELPSES